MKKTLHKDIEIYAFVAFTFVTYTFKNVTDVEL